MIKSVEGTLRFARAPLAVAIAVLSATTFAQDDDTALEEVIVVGSQIKGASISEALAVSVVDAEAIEALLDDATVRWGSDEVMYYPITMGGKVG